MAGRARQITGPLVAALMIVGIPKGCPKFKGKSWVMLGEYPQIYYQHISIFYGLYYKFPFDKSVFVLFSLTLVS